jgi:osmotically-inducible protein OsmY
LLDVGRSPVPGPPEGDSLRPISSPPWYLLAATVPVLLATITLSFIAILAPLVLAQTAPVPTIGPPTDPEIVEMVRVQISQKAPIEFPTVQVLANQRVVTLSGTVETLARAWALESIAGRVKGVLRVDNLLTPLPSTVPDESVADQIRALLAENTSFTNVPIAVTVTNTTATLTGFVSDARLRLVARQIAAGVRGVTAVIDRIEVPSVPDDVILSQVQRLFTIRSFNRVAGEIDASAAGGVVTLEGLVPRPFERDQAEILVLGINGVREVINRLEVDRGCC